MLSPAAALTVNQTNVEGVGISRILFSSQKIDAHVFFFLLPRQLMTLSNLFFFSMKHTS